MFVQFVERIQAAVCDHLNQQCLVHTSSAT
jgi:hypothetical protein